MIRRFKCFQLSTCVHLWEIRGAVVGMASEVNTLLQLHSSSYVSLPFVALGQPEPTRIGGKRIQKLAQLSLVGCASFLSSHS